MKQHSPAYWCKHALSFQSNPEDIIANTVRAHADGVQHGVAFEGSPLELLNTLYVEWRKQMGSVHGCLFPTPLSVARDLAEFAGVSSDDTVFDPGAGLGNLLQAARSCGAKAFGVEPQHWIPPLSGALGLDIQRGDYLDGYKPGPFTCVLTNPPFGNLWGQTDIAAAFFNRLADQCPGGTRIAAILPVGYARSKKPKARVEAFSGFEIGETVPLPDGTFKPLTGVGTEMVRMTRKGSPPPAPVPERESVPVDTSAFVQSTLW